uniref:ASX DEUBAD domain-containing protein n=1 Tax=Plectus sambesii TaxID=2011161 RepID=A0A914XNR9_9BILA
MSEGEGELTSTPRERRNKSKPQQHGLSLNELISPIVFMPRSTTKISPKKQLSEDDSAASGKRLHDLITVAHFTKLSREHQDELIELLPLCDRMAFARARDDLAAREKAVKDALLNEAVNVEFDFFKEMLQSQRVQDDGSYKKVYIAKDETKTSTNLLIDSWKLKHFEPYYGHRQQEFERFKNDAFNWENDMTKTLPENAPDFRGFI